jgi:hypothetical protein
MGKYVFPEEPPLPNQNGNSGKYLTTNGTSTSWGTISGYSAPTLGSTSIASGATVSSIAGLTLTSPTISGTLTANSSTGTSGQVLSSTGSSIQWITPGGGYSPYTLNNPSSTYAVVSTDKGSLIRTSGYNITLTSASGGWNLGDYFYIYNSSLSTTLTFSTGNTLMKTSTANGMSVTSMTMRPNTFAHVIYVSNAGPTAFHIWAVNGTFP